MGVIYRSVAIFFLQYTKCNQSFTFSPVHVVQNLQSTQRLCKHLLLNCILFELINTLFCILSFWCFLSFFFYRIDLFTIFHYKTSLHIKRESINKHRSYFLSAARPKALRLFTKKLKIKTKMINYNINAKWSKSN